MENKEIEKRPVTSIMRDMKVGDVEFFPIEQFLACANSRYRTLRPLVVKEGRKWSVQKEGNITKVTRTA